MVDKPNPVPPNNPNVPDVGKTEDKKTPGSAFNFSKDQKFLGMTFTAKDWNKLMDIFLKNLSDYINKTFQKMTEKMKTDWRRGRGEDE